MTESNYEVIKARLSAEGLPFREEWFKHWVVGRLDVLLVHEEDDAALAFVDEIHGGLTIYPVLDEEDWARREAEYEEDD